jgi:hypothetical protein
MMKRVCCLALILALVCGCLPALAAGEGLKEARCDEQGFKTQIPSNLSARYDEENGLWVSVGKEGYIPFVLVYRRPAEGKLKNPVNYLNNVYREYMENQYGEDMVGTIPCDTYEVGGKNLYAAQYFYRVNGTQLCLVRLVEVRDDRDVEYTAKFVANQGEDTLAALDTVVRYYEPTDTAPQVTEAPQPEPETGIEVAQPVEVAGFKDARCDAQGYATKIPTEATASWNQEEKTFYIWLKQEGYVPNIYMGRRTGSDKLKNPENYIKNTYTSFMQKTYGDRLVGTTLHEYYDIGGKRLLASSYIYRNSAGYAINQIVLVEVRDDGDVEYVARFQNSAREETLAALDAAVRYYQPD